MVALSDNKVGHPRTQGEGRRQNDDDEPWQYLISDSEFKRLAIGKFNEDVEGAKIVNDRLSPPLWDYRSEDVGPRNMLRR